jgi:hypothetical protein
MKKENTVYVLTMTYGDDNTTSVILALSEKNDKGKEIIVNYLTNHIGEIYDEDEIDAMVEQLYKGEVVYDGEDVYNLIAIPFNININSWLE